MSQSVATTPPVQELMAELRSAGVRLRLRSGKLEVSPAGLPEPIRERIRANKTEIITALQAAPETRWPEFEAALQSGAMVLCLRCQHYSGPTSEALGRCAALDVETAPDVPFWCSSFRRKPIR